MTDYGLAFSCALKRKICPERGVKVAAGMLHKTAVRSRTDSSHFAFLTVRHSLPLVLWY